MSKLYAIMCANYALLIKTIIVNHVGLCKYFSYTELVTVTEKTTHTLTSKYHFIPYKLDLFLLFGINSQLSQTFDDAIEGVYFVDTLNQILYFLRNLNIQIKAKSLNLILPKQKETNT